VEAVVSGVSVLWKGQAVMTWSTILCQNPAQGWMTVEKTEQSLPLSARSTESISSVFPLVIDRVRLTVVGAKWGVWVAASVCVR
jgi:hypothetical protein